MPYFNQYRGMNNFGPRNKMPFPPQMAYMAQPIWPMMGDAPIPLGMNNPYMMNPANPMNPQQPIQNGMMDPNTMKMEPPSLTFAIIASYHISIGYIITKTI